MRLNVRLENSTLENQEPDLSEFKHPLWKAPQPDFRVCVFFGMISSDRKERYLLKRRPLVRHSAMWVHFNIVILEE